MLGAHEDVRAELRRLTTVRPEERAALRQEIDSQSLPRWLGHLDRVLAANRDGSGFVVGDAPTYADLTLDYLVAIIGDDGFTAREAQPRLREHAARTAALPPLKEHLASPRRPPFLPLPR